MIRIRDNVWIKSTDITVVEVDDVGNVNLDGAFTVHPKYLTDVLTSLTVDLNEVTGQVERAKHEINT